MHEHLASALARWTKQSVVVIGHGPLALGAFEAARRHRRTALWLGAPAFGSASLRSIALAWPAGSKTRAAAEHARRADHILIAEEDDAEAMAVAKAARAGAPDAAITVLMRDARLAEDAAATLNDAPHPGARWAAKVAARALHAAHPRRSSPPTARPCPRPRADTSASAAPGRRSRRT